MDTPELLLFPVPLSLRRWGRHTCPLFCRKGLATGCRMTTDSTSSTSSSGPPTSMASASGSFPNSGLYGSYPQGQAPPVSQAQGHPGIQPPQRSAPPLASSFTPPTSGGPRMPSMTGSLPPGQGFGGPPMNQPNHVSSPPQALPPGTQMTGLQGPPPPMHSPQQPGYQLQQNGEYFTRSRWIA